MTRTRRTSRRRFRLLPTLLLTVAILGVPTAVYAWGRTSSSFDVKTVTVTGTKLVKKAKVLGLLRREYVGSNLFTVTAADVGTTLEPLCFIATAKVDRSFPDTLAVTVTEHVPAAYALAGNNWYVIAEDGYVICTAAQAPAQLSKKGGGSGSTASPAPSASPSSGVATATPNATATPTAAATSAATTSTTSSGSAAGTRARLIAGPTSSPLPLPRIAVSRRARVGQTLSGRGARGMLRVITALPGSLRRSLAAVEDDDGEITLYFNGGPVAVWGNVDRTLAKTVALRTVLAAYRDAGKKCTRLDVSIPDRTLAKPVLD